MSDLYGSVHVDTITLDKMLVFDRNVFVFFSYFSMKIYVVGTL